MSGPVNGDGPTTPPRPLPSHAAGAAITPDTTAISWRGERMDYGLVIDVLLGQRARSSPQRGNVSAETSG